MAGSCTLPQKAASGIFLSSFLSLCFEKYKDQNVRNVADYGEFETKKKWLTSLFVEGQRQRERERERDIQTGSHSQSDPKTDWLTDWLQLASIALWRHLILPLPCFADGIHSQARRLSSSWAGSAGLGNIAQIGRRSQIRQPRCFFFFLLKVSLTYPNTTKPCTGPLHPPNQTKPNQSLHFHISFLLS